MKIYAIYCHLHCEFLRKNRLMHRVEGQHCHNSHLVREPEDTAHMSLLSKWT
jgi:hypothetical protein